MSNDWPCWSSPKWPSLCRVGRKDVTQSINQSALFYDIFTKFSIVLFRLRTLPVNIQKMRRVQCFEADWSERLTNETIGTSLDAVVGAVPGCGGDLPVVRYRTSLRRCCRLIHSKFCVCCGRESCAAVGTSFDVSEVTIWNHLTAHDLYRRQQESGTLVRKKINQHIHCSGSYNEK